MNHYSLFSGIGGIDLAAEWAGFTTVGQCEKDEYAYRVLCKHWPDVPKVRDVRDVRIKEGSITLLSGGFPCQSFSHAGKRRGKADDRYLWPEMFRVVREARPPWVLGENVTGIINVALDDALSDLESEGYSCTTFNIPACSVEAWHERQRIFIVANSGHNARGSKHVLQQEVSKELETSSTGRLHTDDVPNSNQQGSQGHRRQHSEWQCTHQWFTWSGSTPLKGIWKSEPPVGRVAHGIPSRVDRLKCLGNAVVPQQVYPILKGIAQMIINDN